MKKINKKTTLRNMHGFNKISGPFLGNMQVDIRQNRVGGGGGGGGGWVQHSLLQANLVIRGALIIAFY
jgi:hypothetical protein